MIKLVPAANLARTNENYACYLVDEGGELPIGVKQ